MKRFTHLFLIAALVLTIIPFAATNAAAEKVFIQAAQVAELATANAPKLRIIDCRLDEKTYQKGHVPGAINFNVGKDLRVTGAWGTVGVRQQVEAQEELFGRTLGIDSDTMVILYDDVEDSATRLFWELKYAGHEQVAIMFGGWPEWEKQQLPVEKTVNTATPALFVADVQPQLLATASYIMSKMGNPNTVLLDVRPPEQFKGDKKHPKAQIGGRLPSAVNAFTLANWEHKTYLKNPAELEEKFVDLGVTPDKEIIIYCNTGWYAANTYFVLKALDYPNVRVYDYSWVEWNGKGFLPKIVGKAK